MHIYRENKNPYKFVIPSSSSPQNTSRPYKLVPTRSFHKAKEV
jgi:hypothetical protein